jgi:hypothetical protein
VEEKKKLEEIDKLARKPKNRTITERNAFFAINALFYLQFDKGNKRINKYSSDVDKSKKNKVP